MCPWVWHPLALSRETRRFRDRDILRSWHFSNIRENQPMKGGNSFSIKTTSTSLISFFVSLYFLNIISQRCNLYLQIHHCASIFRKTGIHHHSPQPTGAWPAAEGRHIHIQPVLSAPGHRMLQHLPCTSVITGFHCKVSYPAIQETSLQVFWLEHGFLAQPSHLES